MDENKWLAERFGVHRPHLRGVAYRMLGSPAEADDAVQEAWLRLNRIDAHNVENLGGWLTTVVARVCLDMLRARKSRAEVSSSNAPEAPAIGEGGIDPEQELLLADAVAPALLVVLDTLAPAERVAFVLHDMFAISFEEIALVLGRSPPAARQLASRARRRIQGGGATVPDGDRTRQREIVDAFFAASRRGDFNALLAVLDPDVVLRADDEAVRLGASRIGLSSETRGASDVANFFKGRAQAAKPALVDGAAGAVWVHGGQPRVVFEFAIHKDRIFEITLVGDVATLGQLDLEILEGDTSTG